LNYGHNEQYRILIYPSGLAKKKKKKKKKFKEENKSAYAMFYSIIARIET
jgi:hypothetical protein